MEAVQTAWEEYELDDQPAPVQADEAAGAPTYEPPELIAIGTIEELTLTELDVDASGPGTKLT